MNAHRRQTLQPTVQERDHGAGLASAPVTLVEYGDYQCTSCGQAHPLVRSLQERFGPLLRFVFRNFPLTEIHPYAMHAAEAAESVNAHAGMDAFWMMHHTIFDHQRDSANALDDAHLGLYSELAGANSAQIQADLDADRFADNVRADLLSGVKSGVEGTPTFFINGELFEGNWSDAAEFAAAIESAAASQTSK